MKKGLTKNFIVAGLQFSSSPEPDENIRKALEWVKKAADAGSLCQGDHQRG